MPVRQSLPNDDLYARLGVPRDASPEAIELAWRALLRQHHPDVAGANGLELAKRINVAHDWLSDPDLRRRYDRERSIGVRAGRPPRAGTDWLPRCAGPSVGRRPRTSSSPRSSTASAATVDELDRLALAEPAPSPSSPRCGSSSRPSSSGPRRCRAFRDGASPPRRASLRAVRDAVVGRLADILLSDLLEQILVTRRARGRASA